MKKKVIAGLVVALMLALVVPMALAADAGTTQPPTWTHPFFNFTQPQLTDDQLNELNTIHDQMMNLRKQMIQKYVDFGAISKEDADALTARIDEMEKWRSENGYAPGFGRGMRGGMRGGFRGGWRTQAPTTQGTSNQL